MVPTRTRIASVVVVAAFLASTQTAVAGGLQDALNGMFMSNATAPQAYNSQTRGGFVGGSLALRSPISSINLITFDPPRFNAGCGGIDLFGGSFSFIKSPQLTALFRQIAANAMGAAFMLATCQINPPICNMMKEFQSKVQALNSLFKNTCSIANQGLNFVKSLNSTTNTMQETKTQIDTSGGSQSSNDIFSSISNFFSGSPGGGGSGGTNIDQDIANGDMPVGGNRTWRALQNSNADMYLTSMGAAASNDNLTREIIMSVIGTRIDDTPKDTSDGSGGAQPKPPNILPPASGLTLKVLVDGPPADAMPGTPILYYHCDEYTNCLNPQPTALSQSQFLGVRGYVRKMLLGDPAADTPQSGSILSKLSGCGPMMRSTSGMAASGESCDMTTAQKSFIGTVPTPVIGILKRVQHINGAIVQLQDNIVDMVVNDLALAFMRAVVAAASQAYTNPGNIEVPNEFQPVMLSLRTELQRWEIAAKDNMEKVEKAEKFTRLLAQTNPSLNIGRVK